MFTISCDKCDGDLRINDFLTTEEYMKDSDYFIDELGKLQDDSVQQYLIYKCIQCEELYKFTYKEWEERMRIRTAREVMGLRKQKMFEQDINPYNIDPDNGLEYCGQCDGYDEEGNCLTDIIKQCTIRKK